MYHAATPNVPVARFRPNAEGLNRWFGDTESKIMDVMWNGGLTSYTVKKMWQAVQEDHGHNVAYTTIMTTMTRLYEKGVLR